MFESVFFQWIGNQIAKISTVLQFLLSIKMRNGDIATSMKNDDIAAILIHPIFKGVDFFVGSCVGVCKGDLI